MVSSISRDFAIAPSPFLEQVPIPRVPSQPCGSPYLVGGMLKVGIYFHSDWGLGGTHTQGKPLPLPLFFPLD